MGAESIELHVFLAELVPLAMDEPVGVPRHKSGRIEIVLMSGNFDDVRRLDREGVSARGSSVIPKMVDRDSEIELTAGPKIHRRANAGALNAIGGAPKSHEGKSSRVEAVEKNLVVAVHAP